MPPWLLAPFISAGKWIAAFVIGRLITAIKDWFAEMKEKKEAKRKEREAFLKYTAVVNNPNSTREERKNAEDEYLNS